MHILLEGILKNELQNVLFECIEVQRYFTLQFLNQKITSFEYSYLDSARPEEITRQQLVSCAADLKQTASAMLTLAYLLPYMIGENMPEDNEKWHTFIFLLQIVLLCTSPSCTQDTVVHLEQLIYTHNVAFKRLYPRASFRPKLHYLVHICNTSKLDGVV